MFGSTGRGYCSGSGTAMYKPDISLSLTGTACPCSKILTSMRRRDLVNLSLPDELIIEIFRHLDSKSSLDACALVCKRWHRLDRLSRDSIRIGASDYPDTLVKLLASLFVNVRDVYINEGMSEDIPPELGRRRSAYNQSFMQLCNMADKSETDCLSDVGLAAVVDGFTKLEKLSLLWCSNVTNKGLESVAERFRSLKSLELQYCKVEDLGLAAVGKFCQQLEVLNLLCCDGLTDTGLFDIALSFGTTLKSLSIAACTNITDAALEYVGSHCKSLESFTLESEFMHGNGVIDVVKGCPLLKSLDLQYDKATDEGLAAIGTFCLSLELLALRSLLNFTDQSLSAIGKGCKRLKSLTLNDCSHLTDKGLEAVAVGFPELARLEVSGCHNIGTRGLECLGKSCTRLTELALVYCKKIGNEALFDASKECKYLQAIHLIGCSFIGDDALCGIARGCRNLKKLYIRRCYEVGNKGIIAMSENCKVLTDLSTTDNIRIGDAALVSVGHGCSLLRHLDVGGCPRIGNTGIIAVARGCPQLTYLNASVLQGLEDIASGLEDMALLEIGEGCPLLKDIVLSQRRKVTDVGLSHLVRRCKLLETCVIVNCPGITSVGVATVISNCVHIKKVKVELSKVSKRTQRQAGGLIAYV